MVKIRIEQTNFMDSDEIHSVEICNGSYASDIGVEEILDLFKDALRGLGFADGTVEKIVFDDSDTIV